MIYQGKDFEKIMVDHSIWILSRGRSGKLANLKDFGLDGVNLEMANLPFAEMQSASMKGSFLQGANFRKAKLMHVQLSGARLDGADFEEADLSDSDLSFSISVGTNFSDANLRGCNFVGAKLVDVNFKGADLRGANFKNATLSFVDMREANLDNASFEGTNLDGANFEGAYLKGVNFDKTKYQSADFDGAIFSDPLANRMELPEIELTDLDLYNLISDSAIKFWTKKEDLSVDSISIDNAMIEDAFHQLIDKIRSNISEDQIKAICKEQHGIDKIERVDFEKGNLVSHESQVSIKLDFKISHTLSLLIDRKGNCSIPSYSNASMHSDSGDI